jgi:hypothetical protein
MKKSIEKTIESEKKATSGSLEVSYLLIDNVQKEPVSTLQKIATTINVQLTLPDGEEIPFIPFNEYNHALNEDKIYLYGSSGVGKSRIIYEIVKNKISNLERVFIINPRNTLHEYNSGRIDIYDLVDEFKENDAVLWDNFPDNLVKKDYDSSLEVLEKISSREVKNLLIALKPKYLESYRNIAKDIIELYKHYIKYDKEKIRNITKLYGTNTRYKQIYNKYVEVLIKYQRYYGKRNLFL